MKKMLAVVAIALFTIALPSCKSKVSDADLKANAETALKTNPDLANVTVDAKDGVVTLSGEVKDDATKAAADAALKELKGAKSVSNNTTVFVAPPPVIAVDEALNAGLRDALKDHPTVTATVVDGVVTLSGEIKKADLPTLMQKVTALKPKKIDNKTTVK